MTISVFFQLYTIQSDYYSQICLVMLKSLPYTMSGGWITPPPWIYSIRQLLTKLMKFSRQPVHKFYIQDPLTVCPPLQSFFDLQTQAYFTYFREGILHYFYQFTFVISFCKSQINPILLSTLSRLILFVTKVTPHPDPSSSGTSMSSKTPGRDLEDRGSLDRVSDVQTS